MVAMIVSVDFISTAKTSLPDMLYIKGLGYLMAENLKICIRLIPKNIYQIC